MTKRTYKRPKVSESQIIWTGRRFWLVDVRENDISPFSYDFAMYDGLEDADVAYIKQTSESEYECDFTFPNSDPLILGSIDEIKREIPKVIYWYFRVWN